MIIIVVLSALMIIIMSPLCTQRWGHVALPLSAQSVSVGQSVCPIHFSPAASIKQAVKHEAHRLRR